MTTRRSMIFGGVAAAVAQIVTWVRPATAASRESLADAADDSAQGPILAKTKSIPVGGGKIFKSRKVVVTQPKRGTFRAFSTACTHQGCPVASISKGTINCPCHGSKFKISDGSVVRGPATRALARKRIKISKGVIRLQ
jgi:Rieske Fe-S protein